MGGGTSWSNTFKNGTKLDEGTYLLTTGTRLADGTVLATNRRFAIEAGKTTTLPLELRKAETDVSIIGNFDSESKFTLLTSKKEVSVVSQTGRGYYIIGLLGVGQEPTNHALNDIAKVRSVFDQWQRPMILLFESEAEAAKFRIKEFGQLPADIIFGIDTEGTIRRQIANQMKLQNPNQMPVFIIADTFNRVVFCQQGYTIGLGEQMQKIIQKL